MTVISDVHVTVSPSGSSGPRGNTILSGAGAPDDSIGTDGDYYIDLANYPTTAVFYGPRTATAWPNDGITLANGAGPSPSGGVTTEESFGQDASAGSAATYARGDHTHGTPPTTGLLTLAGGGQLAAPISTTSSTFGNPVPANQGLKAWVCDPAAAGSAFVATAGTLFLSALYVAETFTATSLFWNVSSVPVTPTAGQNFVGLYNANGNLLTSVGVDADITTTGTKTTTISVSMTPGSYWAAFLFNGATAPQLARPTGGPTGASGMVNAGLTAATLRTATNGTGRTSMPASISPASNAVALSAWAAIK